MDQVKGFSHIVICKYSYIRNIFIKIVYRNRVLCFGNTLYVGRVSTRILWWFKKNPWFFWCVLSLKYFKFLIFFSVFYPFFLLLNELYRKKGSVNKFCFMVFVRINYNQIYILNRFLLYFVLYATLNHYWLVKLLMITVLQ